MDSQIVITLVILGSAVLLFVTERLRIDLIALLVMSALALTGLLDPIDALSGFSNPAVVTVWAVFIISGALSKTGVANIIGWQILKYAGTGEMRITLLIMLIAAILSAFMNNIGVAALLLPVVMDIARQTKRPPSKLLMPLAFSSLLGGLMTQIGTPPNILISSTLEANDLRPFGMFDYTPIGLAVTLAGLLFMIFIGRHLLPDRHPASVVHHSSVEQLGQLYNLQQRMFVLRLPANSMLAGQSLADSRLGAVLGLNVAAIIRNGKINPAPQPADILLGGDQLLVTGHAESLTDIQNHHPMRLDDQELSIEQFTSENLAFTEVRLQKNFIGVGRSIQEIEFRQQFDVLVLAIWRQEHPIYSAFDNLPLEAEDRLLVLGYRNSIATLKEARGVRVGAASSDKITQLGKHLMRLYIPPESTLVGKTLGESRLAETFGLAVLGIVRQGSLMMLPAALDRVQAGDMLLVRGESDSLMALDDLQDLQVSSEEMPGLSQLESAQVGLVEAILSPHTTLVGRTLRQLHFREKYGLSVLALLRGGHPYRTNLRDMRLRLGDALLLHGPWQKMKMLAADDDFLVLTDEIQESPRLKKMPIALLILAGVLIPVIMGWLPIYVAAVAGASLMILTGCLNMEEAYRYIEWNAVFLIAGMLPLGIAMQQSGTAQFLAGGVVAFVGAWGPLAIAAALFLIAVLASQFMPNAATAVLLAPIALNAAADLGISPYPLMMTVAIAASASFLSPVGHAANVLVLGPGGYRFYDYLKVGIPLTLVVMGVVLLVLPILWPF